ncbi:CHAD domain-containing protein [Roseomonas sp. CCTCC AB2023176]|uniref:CHAD domain-containing protein n=1 Tax=Roseomonas sp. CCTCC AB2023176 TaxID=3342640 RepID=UPI0035DE93A6
MTEDRPPGEDAPAGFLPAVPVGRPVRDLALEAEIAPEAAARLFRLPCLAGIAAGRSATERLLWLDAADAPLGARGVAAERAPRGPARVVGLAPDWAGEAPAAGDLPAALLPFAGWEGRRREGVLATAAGPVTVALRSGRIRAAAAEAEAARVTMGGAADAVLPLLHALSAEAGAAPPAASLAGQARALSRGEVPRVGPPPRRDVLPDDLDAIGAMALTDAATALLHFAPAAGNDAEALRKMRVAVRRLRAVLKALQPRTACPEVAALDALAGGFGRRLGVARDWDAFLGGAAARVAAALGEPDARLGALVRRAEARRAEALVALREEVAGAGFRRLVWSLLCVAAARPWDDGCPPPEVGAHAAQVLSRRWSRVRRRGGAVEDGDARALHELRLAGKRLRYAALAFAPLWPGRDARRFFERLEELQEVLGQANDAAVARRLAAECVGRDSRRAWAAGLIEGWSLAEEARARKRAGRSWKRLRRTDPFWAAPSMSG